MRALKIALALLLSSQVQADVLCQEPVQKTLTVDTQVFQTFDLFTVPDNRRLVIETLLLTTVGFSVAEAQLLVTLDGQTMTVRVPQSINNSVLSTLHSTTLYAGPGTTVQALLRGSGPSGTSDSVTLGFAGCLVRR